MDELGTLLRTEREKKGVSLAEAEEATRIRRRYLEALEQGQYAGLPAQVYVEGFLRTYALYLGLDPQEAINMYRRQIQESEEARMPVQESVRPLTMPGRITGVHLLLVLALVALGILLFLIYSPYMGFPAASLPPTATPSATPVTTATPLPMPTSLPTFTPTPTPIQVVQVRVRITERAWLRVTTDGTVAFEGLLEAGETRTWIGEEKVTLLTGNAGGTDVTVNGVPKGPLGAPGQVVELSWTNR